MIDYISAALDHIEKLKSRDVDPWTIPCDQFNDCKQHAEYILSELNIIKPRLLCLNHAHTILMDRLEHVQKLEMVNRSNIALIVAERKAAYRE